MIDIINAIGGIDIDNPYYFETYSLYYSDDDFVSKTQHRGVFEED